MATSISAKLKVKGKVRMKEKKTKKEFIFKYYKLITF